jgi:hypothetical protein
MKAVANIIQERRLLEEVGVKGKDKTIRMLTGATD